jgi:hypothetical protein
VVTQSDDEVLESLRSATRVRPVSAADFRLAAGHDHGDQEGRDQSHWLTRQMGRALNGNSGRDYGRAATRPRGAVDVATGEPQTSRRPVAANDLAVVQTQLLRSRVSGLRPGAVPATAVLACLELLGTTRHVGLDDAGRVWQSRAQPSAGGTHSLEPVVHVQRVDGLESGWYGQAGHVAGDVAQLQIPNAEALVTAVTEATRSDSPPAATLFAICDPRLFTGRYPSGSSLLWRDTGAFLMAAHLLAHAHDLSSTLAGLCVEIEVEDGEQPVFAVGAVAIGAVAGGPT